MMTLAQNLKARAKKLGMADAEVARRAGVAERTYANYTTGKRSPDFKTFVRICEVLNSTPNELLGVEKTASGVVVTKSTPDGKARLRLTERVVAGCAALTMDELKLIAAQIDGVVKQHHKKKN